MFARIGQLQRSPQGNLGKIELSSKQWELREEDGGRGGGGLRDRAKMQLKLQNVR